MVQGVLLDYEEALTPLIDLPLSLEGSGSEGDPFFLADKYVEPPVENEVPVPIPQPVYPGGTFGASIQVKEHCCKDRCDHREVCFHEQAICQGEKVLEIVGTPFLSDRNPWSEEESLERPGVGYHANTGGKGVLNQQIH